MKIGPDDSLIRRSGIGISGNHNGGTGAAEFGKIAIFGHLELEPRALAADDGTVKIRLR